MRASVQGSLSCKRTPIGPSCLATCTSVTSAVIAEQSSASPHIGLSKNFPAKSGSAGGTTLINIPALLVQSAQGMAPKNVVDFEEFWSEEAKLRKPSLLQGVTSKFQGVPDLVRLSAGLPPAEAFPLTGLTLTLQDHSLLPITSAQDMYYAQQYSFSSQGFINAVDFLTNLTMKLQKPAGPVKIVMTNGATHAIEHVLACILNAGDAVLCEEYLYFHVLDMIMIPKRYRPCSVGMDLEGMCPDKLRAAIVDAIKRDGRAPKVLYLVPTGQNPTGSSMSMDRKQEIYKICQEYNILILEDDAYYWLQYSADASKAPGLNLPPSFLSLDTDSRVIRIDTLSKLLGPGYRLGWITAHPACVAKVTMAVSASTVGPCSFSQVVVSKIFDHWGMEQFEAYVRSIQQLYAAKAAIAHRAASQHLAGLAEWQPATAGMFMWFKLKHIDNADDIVDALVRSKVVVLPGRAFWTSKADATANCPYFRVSFVSVSDDELFKGLERVGDALKSLLPAVTSPAKALAAVHLANGSTCSEEVN